MIVIDEPQVEYREVPGYPGYQVGSDGSIWSRLTPGKRGVGNGRGCKTVLGTTFKKLSPKPNKDGYFLLCLCSVDGPMKNTHLHRLLAEVFIGPPPDGMQVCHGNGIPTDNRIENLRWGTPKENSEDALTHGSRARGEMCGPAKLTNNQAVEVKRMIAAGKDNHTIAARFGVTHGAICKIRTGKNWSWVEVPA